MWAISSHPPCALAASGTLCLTEEGETEGDNASAQSESEQRIGGHQIPGYANSGTDGFASFSEDRSNGYSSLFHEIYPFLKE